MIPETKTCTKCKVEKPKEGFRVRHQKIKIDVCTYLNSECKCCEILRKKAYRLKNLDRHREYERNYYCKNIEKMQKAKRLDYQKHREKRIESTKIYIQNNPEIAKKSSQNWRNNHPDKVKQKNDYGRKEMVDSYIVDIIKSSSNLSREEIRNQPELIRLTRTIIQIKRKIKNGESNELSATC